MTDLPTCLLIVMVEVDAGIEAAWNRWYDEVHLPDALACPGVLRGRRYRSAGEGSQQNRGERSVVTRSSYATVYELTGPEALKTPQFQAMRGWHEFTGGVVSRTQTFVAL